MATENVEGTKRMAEQIDVLKLVLNELGMGATISTMDERIEIQKAICMVQEAGVQLGYSYNWYVRGPYSPALAADYYSLAHAEQRPAQNLILTDVARDVVSKVKNLMNVPPTFPLPRVYWLELLASVLYLRKRLRLSEAASETKIRNSKPALYNYMHIANAALRHAGLL